MKHKTSYSVDVGKAHILGGFYYDRIGVRLECVKTL